MPTQPAKKAAKKTTKKAAKKTPRYRVTSDRCTLGARGDVIELAEFPLSLIAAGHLTAEKD